ncbi:hypothetical protein AGLY_016563 [Aphis glycines]|uniref:Uncharacterized protein n=1 Tax=Aphis glycines TaxID=307491 RepID=A0A6G0SXE2_APHGL|nr:hypothetical protein AGLY_016563 [Aphis glycines]
MYDEAAKKEKVKKNPNGKRLILTPGQIGGAIPLIPIFARLSALGSLMSGNASVYNEKRLIKTLPDRPLTSRDIIKYIVKFNINHFRGVFSRDDLPKKLRTIECGILNLDVSSGDGSHWLAFYKIKDKVVYFDSFGDLPPPIELQNYFKGYISFILNKNIFSRARRAKKSWHLKIVCMLYTKSV